MRRMGLVALAVVLATCVRGVPDDLSVISTVPWDDPDTSLGTSLRVVAFNVHRRPGTSIARALTGDPALRGADLVTLEEVPDREPCGAPCVAAHLLGFYAAYAPRSTTGDGTEGVAILSRAPLQDARVLQLPNPRAPANIAHSVALAATVEVGGRAVTVYAVHFALQLNTAERLRQLAAVLDDARARATPVIIAGDVNTTPFHWIGHLVPVPGAAQAARLEQLARAYGFATPATRVGTTDRVLGMRLDAIYTRGFRTERTGTARGLEISDHLALWAVLQLQAAATTGSATRTPGSTSTSTTSSELALPREAS